jgi:hypothetical protein
VAIDRNFHYNFLKYQIELHVRDECERIRFSACLQGIVGGIRDEEQVLYHRIPSHQLTAGFPPALSSHQKPCCGYSDPDDNECPLIAENYTTFRSGGFYHSPKRCKALNSLQEWNHD